MPDRFEVYQIIKQRSRHPSGGRLCFQWGTFHYDNKPPKPGYRFVWEDIDGKLVDGSRDKKISMRDIDELLDRALKAGSDWASTLERHS